MTTRDTFLASVLGVPADRLGPLLSAQEQAVDALSRAVAICDELAGHVAATQEAIADARPFAVIEVQLDDAALAAAAAAQLVEALRSVLDEFDVVVQRHARKAAA